MPTDEVTVLCEALYRRQHPTDALLARHVVVRTAADHTAADGQLRGNLPLVARPIRHGAGDGSATLVSPQKAPDIVAILTEMGADVRIATAIYLAISAARELKREPALTSLRDKQGTPLLRSAADAPSPG